MREGEKERKKKRKETGGHYDSRSIIKNASDGVINLRIESPT